MIHINENEYSLERNVEDVRMAIQDFKDIGSIDMYNIQDYENKVNIIIEQLEGYLLPQLEVSIDECK